MKKTLRKFFNLIVLTIIIAGQTACSDSDDGPEVIYNGDGVSNSSWPTEYVAAMAGEKIDFTFTAADAWTAVSNQPEWCKVLTERGRDGNSTLSIEVAPNTGASRAASVTIQVVGASKSAKIYINQTGIGGGPTNLSEVNKWVYDYMKDYYLWNEPIPGLNLNGQAAYESFFNSILTGVDKLDHLNRDDGHWANGQREYYYSYIERESASKSRAFGENETGSGITFMSATLAPGSSTDVWLLPAIIVPESPAAKAGIARGDAISVIDGKTITTSNYQSLASKLNQGGVKVTYLKLNFNSSGSIESYDSHENVSLSKATFEDPAIYKSTVLTLDGGKKVGYILYMYFDMDYDQKLIDIFNQFKAQGVKDLVLDLRYNGGGHVLASTTLATLITGNNYAGKIYNRTTYNKTRSDKGEVGEYKFATAKTPDGNYNKISSAAASGLGLNQIYVLCSENTASASELIINGLRGVDATVNLIGTTTNGKNVGMESIAKVIGSYKYTITPITFYSQNAKDFRDYSDGFTPDVAVDEDEYLYGDFGTMGDPLCNIAFRWIANGSKPNLSMSRAYNPIRRLEIKGQHLPDRLKGSIVVRDDIK